MRVCLGLVCPESWLLPFPRQPHRTHSQQLTVESRWSSFPSTACHLPPIHLSFQQHSRVIRGSPLFSYTFPSYSGFFQGSPLFSTTFPRCSCKKRVPLFKVTNRLDRAGWVSSSAWRMAESLFEPASMPFGLRQRPARRDPWCSPFSANITLIGYSKLRGMSRDRLSPSTRGWEKWSF